MDLFLTLFTATVRALLTTVRLAFLVRAILSWFPISEDNPFLALVMMVTEPVILPFRVLFDHFDWFQNMPIDIPFFAGFLLVNVFGVFVDMV